MKLKSDRGIGQPPAKKKKMYDNIQGKLKIRIICEENNINEKSIENFLKYISLTFINFNCVIYYVYVNYLIFFTYYYNRYCK